MGAPVPTTTNDEGVFIDGFGSFNFQTGSSFLRGTSAGLAINFPSFSVNTDGVVTANEGNFTGDIRATSGFFGTEESQGWNIDGNKLRDANGLIEIDATAASPNITLSSGSGGFIGSGTSTKSVTFTNSFFTVIFFDSRKRIKSFFISNIKTFFGL